MLIVKNKSPQSQHFIYVAWCYMLPISAHNPKEIFILLKNLYSLKNELESYLKNENMANY